MLKTFPRSIPLRSVFLWGGEALLIVSVLWSVLFGFFQDEPMVDRLEAGIVSVLVVALLCQASLYYHNLYGGWRPRSTWTSFTKIIQSIAMAAVLVLGVALILPQWNLGWRTAAALCVLPFTLLLWRMAYAKIAQSVVFDRRVLLIGTSRLAEDVVAALNTDRGLPYTIAQRLTALSVPDDQGRDGQPASPPLLDLVQKGNIHHIVIALRDGRGRFPIDDLLRCKFAGVTIEDGLSFYERVAGKVHLDALKPSWLIFSQGFRRRPLTAFVKRAVDVMGSLVGLIVLAPIGLLLAVLIKLDSPGPVFYRQVRVGTGERPFTLIKLRSMRHDAELDTGPVWAQEHDGRATRVGRWLRILRLDELPQMVNVLRGQMSFVGPRPERPNFVDRLKADIPYYGLRHTVKPGITGLAQTRYAYGASVEDAIEKLQYDLCYIKNFSMRLDLSIFIDTLKIVVLRRGAR